MDLNRLIEHIRESSEFSKTGMIAAHLGVVRGTSLDGRPVTGMRVEVDGDALQKIVDEVKAMEGIVDVAFELQEGRLRVGEEIMAIAIAGDTRDHVYPALELAVERIKTEATKKTEFFESRENGE